MLIRMLYCKLTRVLYSTYNISLRIHDVTYDMLDLQQQLHKHRSGKNCFIIIIIIRLISKSMMMMMMIFNVD